jgi:phospholipid/cholesterol/gamma-HCH transport system substrate-binding protein
MKNLFTREVKIGATAIAALVLLYFGMNFLKGLVLFSDDISYKISFNDLKGLSKSTPIYAHGYKVGIVTAINYDFEHEGSIEVLVDLDKRLKIPEDTKATIISDLMGNTKVNLVLGKMDGKYLEPGSTITSFDQGGVMSDVKDMMPTIQAMLPKIDSIMHNLNIILSDPALLAMLHNMNEMSGNLNRSSEDIQAMMAHMNQQMPKLLEHTTNTMANTEAVTSDLKQADVTAMMQKVNKTLDNVEQMTNALNNREGTLGLLKHDKTLYNNLNTTVASADSLLVDLKAHPKRYVHFSLF